MYTSSIACFDRKNKETRRNKYLIVLLKKTMQEEVYDYMIFANSQDFIGKAKILLLHRIWSHLLLLVLIRN